MFIEDLIKNDTEGDTIIKDIVLQEEVITQYADLINCTLIFKNCTFNEPIRLYGNVFMKDVLFENCIFDSFVLTSVTFRAELTIKNNIFRNTIFIDSCLFMGMVKLLKNQTEDGINIFKDGNNTAGPVEFTSGLVID